MTSAAKFGVVGAGYVAAFVVAWLAVELYVAATAGPDRHTYAAMYAFGDSILFLAVLGVAALPPTGAAFYFLRPVTRLWRALAITAGVAALVSIAAAVTYAAKPQSQNVLVMLTPMWMLATPLLAATFVLSGLFAPIRSARIALLACGVLHLAVFGYAMTAMLGAR
jgi:hypothetical protein